MIQDPEKGVALSPRETTHLPTVRKLLEAYRELRAVDGVGSMPWNASRYWQADAKVERLETELKLRGRPGAM